MDGAAAIAVTLGDLDHLQSSELASAMRSRCCTYDEGYTTQDVFACTTCFPDGEAGFCAACAAYCHDGHELVELDEKRSFRCDCGTQKCSIACSFTETNSRANNEENKYNHNFKGCFCFCEQTFDADNDTMVQCIQCEDWFHTGCLGCSAVPENATLYCKICVADHPWLMNADQSTLASKFESNAFADVVNNVTEVWLPYERVNVIVSSVPLREGFAQRGVFLPFTESCKAEGSTGSTQQSIDTMAADALNKMPRAQALHITHSFQKFISTFKQQLHDRLSSNPSDLITEEDVHAMLAGSSVLGKRRR